MKDFTLKTQIRVKEQHFYVFITFYTAIPYTNLNSVDRIGSTVFSLGGDKIYFVSHHSFLWYKWLP